MCIAIAKKAGHVLTDDVLKRCFQRNQDGCGFAVIGSDRRIRIYKSLNFAQFLPELRRAEAAFPDSPMLIHFRIKTHGKVDLDNCHPFMVDDNHVFIHNGVINKVPTHKEKSDTQVFNNLILQRLPTGWFGNPAIQPLLKDYIGYGSKLCIMNSSGDIDIINESAGHWEDGGAVWYSNTGYKDWQSTTFTPACTTPGSYHGQIKWSSRISDYLYWNQFTKNWEEEVDADKGAPDDYIPKSADRLTTKALPTPSRDEDVLDVTADDLDVLSRDKIIALCKELEIDKHLETFEMTITTPAGATTTEQFSRCHWCWQPDYSDYIHPYQIEGTEVQMCDDCKQTAVKDGLKVTLVYKK